MLIGRRFEKREHSSDSTSQNCSMLTRYWCPAPRKDEIIVMDHNAKEDGTWNIDSMLLSSG
jgi:hypothetical protein